MVFGIFDEKRKTRREEYDGYEYKGGPDSTEDLAIDGKSFSYRDPNADKHVDYMSGRGPAMSGKTINKDAYQMTNPLYEYSYGQIRDAAKAQGIQNINEKDEVDSILKHIQSPPPAVTKPKNNKKQKSNTPDIPEYMDPAKPIQLSNKAANAEATISAYNQRFDSPAAQAAYDLKDKYALDLKSGLGQRGQGFTSIQSSGWDNGMSQSFADNKKKLIAQNLQPGWNQATMGA